MAARSFLQELRQEPNPSDLALMYQRRHQRRPLSRNPFVKTEEINELTTPELTHRTSGVTDEQDSTKFEPESEPELKAKATEGLATLKNPGPTWVYLFYDLAWTATFATLTANGQLNELWDSFSYIAFFVVLWWMWASQVLYSVHFYTNDWFHLISIFLQLILFGMLAATTRGYDITNYILHSPGISKLIPMDLGQITDPDRYAAENIAKLSMDIIAACIAFSRVLLFIQYSRVLWYAHRTVKASNMRIVWWKLWTIPLGLVISMALFFAAWGVARSPTGRTHRGAKYKFIFWGVGLVVEIATHIGMAHISWLKLNNTKPPSTGSGDTKFEAQTEASSDKPQKLLVPSSNVGTRERLEAITTIILGEGINGIAGTLYSVISTPTVGGPIVANVACTALLVYFLAHLYFEGIAGNRELKEHGRRRVYWVLLHLPFLLSVVLLLQGVKNQFLLTSFLTTTDSSFRQLDKVIIEQNLTVGHPGVAENQGMKTYFIERGLSWGDEYNNLMDLITQNNTVPLSDDGLSDAQNDQYIAWNARLSLKIVLQLYQNFMEKGDQIPKNIQDQVDQYNNNLQYPLDDWNNETESLWSLHYYQILTDLLKPKLETTRYIVATAGIVLVSMAVLDLIHSRPRDRFQWGSVLSRSLMGLCMLLLLLLNIGHYQTLWVTEDEYHQQAGIFRWLEVYWVLPTITIAFGIQFIVDVVLVWFAYHKYYPTSSRSFIMRACLKVKSVVLWGFRWS